MVIAARPAEIHGRESDVLTLTATCEREVASNLVSIGDAGELLVDGGGCC